MIEITVIIAVVMGVTEAIKQIGFPAKFAALLSIALGLAFAFLTNTQGDSVQMTVFTGFVIGLTAAGLYSGTKATYEGIKQK